MTTSNYAYQIETAAVTALQTAAGAGQSLYGLVTTGNIKREPPQPDDAIPEMMMSLEMPSIFVQCIDGDMEIIGTGPTYERRWNLRLRCVVEKNTGLDAEDLCRDIAEAACKAVQLKNGVSNWISSSKQVLIPSWDTSRLEMGGDDNPYLVVYEGTLPVSVVHTD